MPAKGYKMERNNIIDLAFYKKFKAETGINIDYKTFKSVIVDSNEEIANIIIDGNDGFRLPKGLGAITVSKYKAKPHQKRIDWLNSNKFKKRIYHLNLHTYGYSFAIRWFKHDITKFGLAGIYKFKACRSLSRAVSKKAKETQGKQYFEWKFADFYESSRLERYLMRRNKNTNGNNSST